MTTERLSDPADKAADGAFGGVTTHSHRAGYGDDKLARLVAWLRAHPTTTLASGEGALLLAEIDRLARILWVMDDMIDRLHAAAKDSADHYADARAEIDRLRRILAALREPSANVIESANVAFPFAAPMVRAAVAAAEQEVGRE